MQVRIRAEMASKGGGLLKGIVETDETYVGGKPRKGNKRKDDEPKNPRGRGTKKTPIIGAVERGGKVVAKDLTGRGVLKFIRNYVNPDGAVLMTDEYQAYNAVDSAFKHELVSVALLPDSSSPGAAESVWESDSAPVFS